MRLSLDLRHESKRDVGAFSESPRRFLDQREFEQGIDLDRENIGVDRLFDLPDFLARAVEDDLIAAKPDLERLPEFAAGIDFPASLEHT